MSGKPEARRERVDYGTHTLPEKFWTTVQKGKNLLNDDAWKRRRAAKHDRLEQNRSAKAEANRRRGSR